MDLDERTLASVAAYDAHAAAYQQSLRLKRPVADVRRFADRARRDDLVLDAGCGPANDLRLLRDTGVHPVGVDLAMGALREARMLLPRHPLVCAPLHALPFRDRAFAGLWLSGALTHLPRAAWRPVFADLLRLVDHGPVYLACYRGSADLEPLEDPVLGEVYVSAAVEAEIEALFGSHGLQEVTIEVRPDPVHDRRRPWVVALGTLTR
ncbi:class I SAM-dependent methyltransferase [Egicoccus sp. AB-alg6-2]|uniref:class I SAM-dependent methyltransferase n=1 Tax=Egicoccus sp. AB-alg6-2 TaxID=3242692 RepID=UPI00359DC8A1